METQDTIYYDSLDIATLCQYLTENHLTFERKIIAEIKEHIEVVLKVEKSRLGEMPFVRDNFLQLAWKMEQHIDAEERIIFPFAEKFDSNGELRELVYLSELEHVVDFLQKLGEKHKGIFELVEAIRNLTHHYNADVKDSPTHKLCFEEIQRLDLSIHRHFFILDNVLLKKLEQAESVLRHRELGSKNEIKNK